MLRFVDGAGDGAGEGANVGDSSCITNRREMKFRMKSAYLSVQAFVKRKNMCVQALLLEVQQEVFLTSTQASVHRRSVRVVEDREIEAGDSDV